jgi:hypothetical protein
MPPFLAGLLKDFRFWLVVVVLGLSAALYLSLQESQRLRNEAEIAQAKSAQNAAALQDSLSKQAATFQSMAVRVANLNDSVTVARREYKILSTKYILLVASVRDSGSGIVVDGKDSTGTYKQVSFSGHWYIARYSGFTRAYITPMSTGKWFLQVDFDTVRTQSDLLFDKASKLFYIRTTSLTDGVVLLGHSVLDSAAYPILYRMEVPSVAPAGWFYVGGTVSRDFVALGVAVRAKDWLITTNYQFFNRMLIENHPWYDRVQIGVYYSLF